MPGSTPRVGGPGRAAVADDREGRSPILDRPGPGELVLSGGHAHRRRLARRLRENLFCPVRAAPHRLRARRWARRWSPAARRTGAAAACCCSTCRRPRPTPSRRRPASTACSAAEDMLDGADADNWRRAVMLLETVEATELIGPHVGAEQLLLRLFSDEARGSIPRSRSASAAPAAPEKVIRSLAIYRPSEIGHDHSRGKVTADCQFCGAHYEFDPAGLGRAAGPPARGIDWSRTLPWLTDGAAYGMHMKSAWNSYGD